jgi:hypothetical protein
MRWGKHAPASLGIGRLVLGWQAPALEEAVAAGWILV